MPAYRPPTRADKFIVAGLVMFCIAELVYIIPR